FQGTALGRAGASASEATIRNLVSPQSPAERAKEFELIRELNAEQLKANPGDTEFEAVANSYELAWRMQGNAPDVLDLSKESKETQAMYAIGQKEADTFGRECLMARRSCEWG